MPVRPRIAVFIDYQNCYGAARRVFHRRNAPATSGHFMPQAMAAVLADKDSPGQITYVGVYSGVPNQRKDPRTAAARQRQIAAWQRREGITVVTRALRYPRNWPAERAEEKGIDVKLAVDAVMLAVRGAYDIGIIASCDTDLAPVVEALRDLHQIEGGPRVELVAWSGRKGAVQMKSQRVRYRSIDEDDYRAMQDLTDYDVRTVPQAIGSTS